MARSWCRGITYEAINGIAEMKVALWTRIREIDMIEIRIVNESTGLPVY